MGLFSWLTSDTKEQIKIGEDKDIYLLSPGGGKSYHEDNYGGRGLFGTRDVYVHLCEINMPQLIGGIAELNRDVGLILAYGKVYYDKRTDKYYGHKETCPLEEVLPMEGDLNTKQSGYGKTPNELISEGVWDRMPTYILLLDGSEYFPIKIACTPDAVYEDLEEAEDDGYQGGDCQWVPQCL